MPTNWSEDPSRRPSSERRTRARTLRRTLTDPERRLWWHLRHRLPLELTHFRRQAAIGPYIADFCCLRRKLIVEVDGEQHGFEENRVRDAKRTAYLEEQGFRVLRFSNGEVMRSIDVVLDTIFSTLHACTSATHSLPPCGGELERGVVGVELGVNGARAVAASEHKPATSSSDFTTPTPTPPRKGEGK